MSVKAFHFPLFALILLSFALNLPTAASNAEPRTASVIVGVNVYDEGFLSQPDQDSEIERLAQNGVKTIRTRSYLINTFKVLIG